MKKFLKCVITAMFLFPTTGHTDELSRTLTEMAVSGALVVPPDAEPLLDLRGIPFLIGEGYQTDNAPDAAYLKINGIPQSDVINTYYLTPDQLQQLSDVTSLNRLGLDELRTCFAVVDDDLRYIICNGPSLLQVSRELSGHRVEGNSGELFLATLILIHEIAHHLLSHPTLDPTYSVSAARSRELEREADTGAARMLAQTLVRGQLYSIFFDGAVGEREDVSREAWLVDFLFRGGLRHDEWHERFRRIAVVTSNMFVDGRQFRGVEPVRLDFEAVCAASCDWEDADRREVSLASDWLALSDADKRMMANLYAERLEVVSWSADPLQFLARCQAEILAGEEPMCLEEIRGSLDELRSQPSLPELTALVAMQTVQLVDAERFSNDFFDPYVFYVSQMVEPFYSIFWGDDYSPQSPSPSFSYLSWLNGEGQFVDCGQIDQRRHPSQNFHCPDFADLVQEQIFDSSLRAALSTLIAAQIANSDEFLSHSTLLADLLTLGFTARDNHTTLPAVISILMDAKERVAISENPGAPLILALLLSEIGFPSHAETVFAEATSRLEDLGLNRIQLFQIHVEILYDCLNEYLASCAEMSIESALATFSERDQASAGDINRIEHLNFELARVRILQNRPAEAITIIEELIETVDPADGRSQVAFWETIAEAHILACNGDGALRAMDEVLRIIDDLPHERDADRVRTTLGYRISAAFLTEDRDTALELLNEADSLWERDFAFSITGSNPMVAICGGVRRISETKAWAEG